MTERQPISRTVRFEVFKRDKFTCQYCGKKAPDVLLEVDHIKPVALGGTNDIINLVTSCRDCNGGKGARQLDDNSIVEKQRRQIEELEERRTQLEMMLRWRDEVKDLNAQVDRYVADHIIQISGLEPNENGMRDIRRWVKKFPLDVLLGAIDEAFAKHLIRYTSGIDSDSWNRAFGWVERFARSKQRYGDGPEVDRMLYIQGILRRRTGDRYMSFLDDIKELYDLGFKLEDIERAAKTTDSLTEFTGWQARWVQAARSRDKEVPGGQED